MGLVSHQHKGQVERESEHGPERRENEEGRGNGAEDLLLGDPHAEARDNGKAGKTGREGVDEESTRELLEDTGPGEREEGERVPDRRGGADGVRAGVST
jgi:hypothetical protein